MHRGYCWQTILLPGWGRGRRLAPGMGLAALLGLGAWALQDIEARLLGQLNDYVDGELADELCHDLEQHMAQCTNCRVVFDTLRKTIVLYHALGNAPVELPADVEARLLSRLNRTPPPTAG